MSLARFGGACTCTSRGRISPRQPDRVQVVLLRARRVIAHRGARLGQEVLDDHLLHVAVAGVGGGDGLQRVDPVLAVLADADQDARRERDPQLARALQRGEAAGGQLVRRAAMARQVLAQALDHHALRDGDALQELQLLAGDGAGVGVREQPGLLDDELAHRRQVLDRATRSRWPPAIRAPPRTGSRGLPEREQRLVAARFRALQRDLDHLLGRHVRGRQVLRWLRERAVPAAVATELRERDEDLGRERDPIRHLPHSVARGHDGAGRGMPPSPPPGRDTPAQPPVL